MPKNEPDETTPTESAAVQHVIPPGSRILVVDDSATNRLILKFVLEAADYQIREADNGENALLAARLFAPHVILMDVLMPCMDGFEACRRLKKDAQLAGIPVIFLTAMDEKEVMVNAFEAGGVDFITKPFDDREVLARVGTHAELYINRLKLQEYARRVKEELVRTAEDEEAGRRVQFKLLPKDGMQIGGCEFHRLLMPSMHMSGDFVDYFRIDEHRLGFYILDVAGHGAASAFVTVMIKSSISHAMARYQAGGDDTICDPARLLGQLNAELIQDGLEKHAAMFYVVLDQDGREMRYANSGHFPFPILCTDNSTQVLESRSRPLGIFETAKYTTVTMPMPEAFSLLLFSDGVLDLLPEPLLAGKLARMEAMGRSNAINLQDIRTAINLDGNRELPDDVTILTVTRRAT
jgi:serine phosphatase RsbU (regulator of sigma subunit)